MKCLGRICTQGRRRKTTDYFKREETLYYRKKYRMMQIKNKSSAGKSFEIRFLNFLFFFSFIKSMLHYLLGTVFKDYDMANEEEGTMSNC